MISTSLIFHAVDTAVPRMQFNLINLPMLKKALCQKKEVPSVFQAPHLLICHNCPHDLFPNGLESIILSVKLRALFHFLCYK